jgi:hypothetical protein
MRDSDSNQRHNLRFKRHAEELGLEAHHAGWRGWAQTVLLAETAHRYADEIARLGLVVTVEPVPAQRRPDKNLARYACSCVPARTLRMWTPAFEIAPLVCGACGQVFVES